MADDPVERRWIPTTDPPAKWPRERQGTISAIIPVSDSDPALIERCIKSVRESCTEDVDVFVIVCPPPEEWVSYKGAYDSGAVTVFMEGEYDWGRCVSQGIKRLPEGCAYVLILDPSTQFDKAGDVDKLREAIDEHHWAYAEPRILGYDKSTTGGPATSSCAMWDRAWLTRVGSPDSGYRSRAKGSVDYGVNKPGITIVITNYKRPDKLWAAYRSCIDAGMTEIVISSSGVDEEMRSLHSKILAESPQVTILADEHDDGCNANWLAGVRAAPSDFVTILHDDDTLLPTFHEIYDDWDPDADFYAWDGAKHGSGATGTYPTLADYDGGMHGTRVLYSRMLYPDQLAISPVGGCFPKEHLIEVLTWCEENFKGDPLFHTRPTMMVGNDMLIWLRAVEKYSRFKYIKTPRVSYGHFVGSASYDDAIEFGTNPSRTEGLLPIYTRIKDLHLSETPKIIHVLERHAVSGETARRVAAAEASWDRLYLTNIVVPLHVWDYKRDTGFMGDKRRCPFLRDILAEAMGYADDDDIIMLTNDDTVLHPLAPWAILNMMTREDCLCAMRVSFDKGRMPDPSQDALTTGSIGKIDGGRDLFAMRKSWLTEHFHLIPDYTLGSSDWDSTLSLAMRLTKGMEVIHHDWMLPQKRSELPMGHVYHEWHTAFWTDGTNRHVLNTQLWNRELTVAWQRKHGIGWTQRCS